MIAQLALQALGAAVVAYGALTFAYFVWRVCLRPAYDLKMRYGSGWALVTGATDGIGKALATELAKAGFNVLLVSRTQSKLDEVASELKGKFPSVQVDTLAVDFASFSADAQKAVVARVAAMKDSGGLCALVNNVGVGYDYPMYFHEMPHDVVASMLRVNCDSVAIMTHLCLPAMLERKGKAKKGLVMNVASASGLGSLPLLAHYSATKAYVIRLTEGLAAEYPALDVNVQAPYYVVSKLSKFKRASLTVPTPAAYVVLALDCVGYETVSNPHWAHSVMGVGLNQLLPTPISDAMLVSMHKAVRAKALSKKNKGE